MVESWEAYRGEAYKLVQWGQHKEKDNKMGISHDRLNQTMPNGKECPLGSTPTHVQAEIGGSRKGGKGLLRENPWEETNKILTDPIGCLH